jgi:hypothetical protein
MTWAIVAWFALQLPLAVLVGKCMKFGLAEPARQTSAMRRRSVPRGTRLRADNPYPPRPARGDRANPQLFKVAQARAKAKAHEDQVPFGKPYR